MVRMGSLAALVAVAACAPNAHDEVGSTAATGSTAETGIPPSDTGAPPVGRALQALPDAVRADLMDGVPTRVIVRVARPVEPGPGVLVTRTFRHLPFTVLELEDVDAARELIAGGSVLSMEPELIFEHFLTESLAHVGQPAVAADGFRGAGTAVAVLDSGADWTHPDLGACSAAGAPGCPVVYEADFAPDDRKRDDRGRHGTNVSAIVSAVAPDAAIIALDVFNGGGASSIDVLNAIDWVIDNQATYNIASMNLSLGFGAHTQECGGTSFDEAFNRARAAGISVVAATGNHGYINAISTPACTPGALKVGAVHSVSNNGYDCTNNPIGQDSVACFSNTASFLDVLAPGVDVNAGGVEMSGTSMAAPHVAGAMAVLRAANPDATVAELEALLLDNGAAVVDRRTGQTFPRLDLAAAMQGSQCQISVSSSSVSVDPLGESGVLTVSADPGCAWSVSSSATWLGVDPAQGNGPGSFTWMAAGNLGGPRSAVLEVGGAQVTVSQAANNGEAGTVLIDGGAEATRSSRVTLAVNAPGATAMCFSNDDRPCSRWVSYAPAYAWRLAGKSGLQTVTAWFRGCARQRGPAGHGHDSAGYGPPARRRRDRGAELRRGGAVLVGLCRRALVGRELPPHPECGQANAQEWLRRRSGVDGQ